MKVELSHLESKSYLICELCSEVKVSYVIFTKVIFQFSLLHERGAKPLVLAMQIHTRHHFHLFEISSHLSSVA